MTGAETAYLPAGDGVLTRMVLRKSQERGLDVEVHKEWNGYGYATRGYTVDVKVLDEALVLHTVRSASRRKQRRFAAAREREVAHQAWLDEIRQLLPRLDLADAAVSAVVQRAKADPDPTALIHRSRETLPLDHYPRSVWRRLGYDLPPDTTPRALLCLAKGARVIPLFAGRQVRSTRSRWASASPERLWARYCALGLGLAHAIWAANKLIKILSVDLVTSRAIYNIKDRFIESSQDFLVEGRVAREEVKHCWSCQGLRYHCHRCSGTGIYSSRILYEHILEMDGRAWSFHSYFKPRTVSDTRGADLKRYGKRLSRSDRIPLRLPEYQRMIPFALEQRENGVCTTAMKEG